MVPECVSLRTVELTGRDPAADLLRRGQAAARRGDRPRARRLLRATLIADPTNTEAKLWLAALADDPRESVQLLSEVLQASPGNVRAAAGLRWAWERQEALQAARITTPPPIRPQFVPLPQEPRAPGAGARAIVARLATAVACPAGALAIVFVVSCSQADWPPAAVVNAWVAASTEAPPATPEPTAIPTALPAPGRWIEATPGEQAAVALPDDSELLRTVGGPWSPSEE